jgi:hypothetical protein
MERSRYRSGDQTGASAIEFILLLPALLALLLMILQIALLAQAKFVVNYAAYSAARAASVVTSTRAESIRTGRIEDRNRINLNDSDSPKLAFIRHAAALPLVGISPLWSPEVFQATGAAPIPSLAVSMRQVAAIFPASAGETNLSEQLLARAHYAYNKDNVSVEIIQENGRRDGVFRDHEQITIRITFRYYLAVPFANRLFGKRYYGGSLLNTSGWYYPITEQYTVVNEGEPVFPQNQSPRGSDIRIED